MIADRSTSIVLAGARPIPANIRYELMGPRVGNPAPTRARGRSPLSACGGGGEGQRLSRCPHVGGSLFRLLLLRVVTVSSDMYYYSASGTYL